MCGPSRGNVPRKWNDKISSLKVEADDNKNKGRGRRGRRGRGRGGRRGRRGRHLTRRSNKRMKPGRRGMMRSGKMGFMKMGMSFGKGGHFRRGKSFSLSFTMGNAKVSFNSRSA